jgi:hygromycin-B 4-O-kinase
MQITNNNLLRFLSDQLHAEITHIEPVRQGEWSRTFFFSSNGLRKVVRFSAFEEDYQKDCFAARFSSTNLPIPPIEAIGKAFGLFFAISPHVVGKMIDQLSAGEMRDLLPALMELFFALREVDGSQTRGYGGLGADGNGTAQSWRVYLPQMPTDEPGSRLYGWKNNLAQNQEADELFRMGRERLLDLVPLCPEARHLIHNDLLHFNLLTQGQRIVGVIDWGCAMWGDFLYDLAMFTAWQFYYPAMEGIDFAHEAQQFFARKAVALPDFKERLRCYQLHLLLDSMVYNAWKNDPVNMAITMRRLQAILAG